MAPYISLERRNLAEMMQKLINEESVDRDGALPVLSSSVNMFVYIKNSVKRCTALATGQTFFDLHKVFKEALRQYADQLQAKFPPPPRIIILKPSLPP